MVVALGPGRFYGGGLPRPRVFPGDRIDPPAPVTDALLCWARDAHWSMGGLAAKRLRLQGRIEGNLVKLRRTARRDARVSAKSAKVAKSKVRAAGHRPAPATLDDALGSDDDDSEDEAEVAAHERALRREVVDDDSDSDSESGESEGEGVPLVTIAAAAKRKRVRKLSDEFDRIADAQLDGGGKKKPAAAAPAKAPLRKKAPAAEAPVKKSLKRKAVAPAAVTAARTSPKRKAAEAPAARRTSPRSKH
ncbi:60S ribosomal protein L22-like [Triticum dicoccoides]|uniref:60S ribosomal protein L22-like n=1 Tax=Triticum dicoccoides TaxID=85692 RepID=UPI00188DDA5A|nr:60S ribosomal protein L22-like [Triticum dicoccoides]